VDEVETAGKNYPDMVTWWVDYVERKIRFLFNQEGTARLREYMLIKHFYYRCI